jgi:cytochrome c
MKSLWITGAAATLVLGMFATTALAGDATNGEKVFNKCKACHEATTDKNKVGPTLKGLFGRTAGTVEGYKYSDAMKASGIVWGEDTLATYLKDPKAMVPKNKMSFAGLKKDDEIADVIAYLEEATKQ